MAGHRAGPKVQQPAGGRQIREHGRPDIAAQGSTQGSLDQDQGIGVFKNGASRSLRLGCDARPVDAQQIRGWARRPCAGDGASGVGESREISGSPECERFCQ
jgi:hypothetical protein